MTCAEVLGYGANLPIASFAVAALLGPGALQIVLAGDPADGWLLYRARTGPFQINAGRTANTVLLFGLHQTAVHRRAARFPGRVAAEKRSR